METKEWGIRPWQERNRIYTITYDYNDNKGLTRFIQAKDEADARKEMAKTKWYQRMGRDKEFKLISIN
jgi:hypothetical protein